MSKGRARHTRVTGVGIRLCSALGDVQIAFSSDLVERVLAAAEDLAGVAMAVKD